VVGLESQQPLERVREPTAGFYLRWFVTKTTVPAGPVRKSAAMSI
jgi:hypothetical protein